MATATYTSLDAATEPSVGKVLDHKTMKRSHTMFVRVEGRPLFFEVLLSLSHDGVLWYDAATVGGSTPDHVAVHMVGFDACARFVRAQVVKLDVSEQEASVTATIGSA